MPWSPAKLGCSLLQGGLQLLYPKLCWACGTSLPVDGDAFCPACEVALTGDASPTCPKCSSTVGPFANVDQGCPSCRDAGFAFERAVRLGPYDGLLREIVLRLKHETGEGLAEVVGRLWVCRQRQKLKDLQADLVAPVPLHWVRRWRRGYNQAETLARAVARGLGLPYLPRCLRRVRNTPQQTLQVSNAQREENVRNAFSARAGAAVRGKRMLLVDDVLTTGATASAAARALRRAGAASVVVGVLAHGHGRQGSPGPPKND